MIERDQKRLEEFARGSVFGYAAYLSLDNYPTEPSYDEIKSLRFILGRKVTHDDTHAYQQAWDRCFDKIKQKQNE